MPSGFLFLTLSLLDGQAKAVTNIKEDYSSGDEEPYGKRFTESKQ